MLSNDKLVAIVWFALGFIGLVWFVLFEAEAYTYWFLQPHITQYVRNWTWGHWIIAIVIAIAVIVSASVMITHFVVDAAQP